MMNESTLSDITVSLVEMAGPFLEVLEIFVYSFGISIGIAAVLAVPAFYIGKAIGKRRKSESPDTLGNKGTIREWLRLTLTIVLVLCFATVVYLVLSASSFHYSSAFFLGVPLILALCVYFLPKSQSRYLNTAKIITVFLGFSYWVLGEGIICVFMAMPLFYLVGFAVVYGFERVNKVNSPIVIALLIFLCLEGTSPAFSFNRNHSAGAQGVVNLSVHEVQKNLAGNPDLSELPLGVMLRIGFPVPAQAIGTGLKMGDTREFSFKRRDGVLENVKFEVTGSSESHVKLSPVFDNTVIDRWLGWQDVEIHWEALSATSTKVSVNMAFERRLDPVWYFAPLQKWIVGQAAEVLIGHAGMVPEE